MAWTLVERASLIHDIASPDYSTFFKPLMVKSVLQKLAGLAGVRIKLSRLNIAICM